MPRGKTKGQIAILDKDAAGLKDGIEEFAATNNIFDILFNRAPDPATVARKNDDLNRATAETRVDVGALIDALIELNLDEDDHFSESYETFVSRFMEAYEPRKIGIFQSLPFEGKKGAKELISYHIDSILDLLKIDKTMNGAIKRGVGSYLSLSPSDEIISLYRSPGLWFFILELYATEKYATQMRALKPLIHKTVLTMFRASNIFYEALTTPDFDPDASIAALEEGIHKVVELKTQRMKAILHKYMGKLKENFIALYRSHIREKEHNLSGVVTSNAVQLFSESLSGSIGGGDAVDILKELKELKKSAGGDRKITTMLNTATEMLEKGLHEDPKFAHPKSKEEEFVPSAEDEYEPDAEDDAEEAEACEEDASDVEQKDGK